MIKIFWPVLILLAIILFSCQTRFKDLTDYDAYPVYEGDDLGLTYTPEQSAFRIWAPSASQAVLRIYAAGQGGEPLETIKMKKGPSGTWAAVLQGDQEGRYYTFQVQVAGTWRKEVPDPYVRAVGVNGLRGQVVDLDKTDPGGWDFEVRPPFTSPTDAVIYELHIRDVSVAPNSGINSKGKFLGLAERGTTSPEGYATGLDHLRELGITHVHLLPSFDYASVDESRLDEPQYNWGYDPRNYNVPEGSYATDPADGAVRIREFKEMVQALHEAGIRVILDVVYNHTFDTDNSSFEQLVPGYYYRHNPDGSFSNASACGNETASERPMMRKFILESVRFWVEEYHLDGFRFDLMGIHDQETMQEVVNTLHQIDPSILVYGEGWTAGDSPLPLEERTLKQFVNRVEGLAAFSDDLRDGLKGSVFEVAEKGFVSGAAGMDESIKFGVVASTEHPQVDYEAVNYSDAPWARDPVQTISYVSCHDNHTLWDRLLESNGDDPEAERLKMHQLALTIVLTAQGIPFLHAGTEMRRTKGGVENSFESPDAVNRIDWSWKAQHHALFEYVRELIRIRKNHPAFRMTEAGQVQQYLRFLETPSDQVVAFIIDGKAVGDTWERIVVAYNGGTEPAGIPVPAGEWTIVTDGAGIAAEGIGKFRGSQTMIPARGAVILYSNALNKVD